MRASLVLMMALGGAAIGSGASYMSTGGPYIGGAAVIVGIAVAVFAFVRGSNEDAQYTEATLVTKASIDEYNAQVRLDRFNSGRRP
jgi:hypothetical protein